MQDNFYNYTEDEILDEVLGYITSTYGQHYAGKQDIQLFDYWQSIGILTPVAIGTAMKYLARYGKKQGANRKDLLKAMHYVVLALWSESLNEDELIGTNQIENSDLVEDDEGFISSEEEKQPSPIDFNNFSPFTLPFDKLLDELQKGR